VTPEHDPEEVESPFRGSSAPSCHQIVHDDLGGRTDCRLGCRQLVDHETHVGGYRTAAAQAAAVPHCAPLVSGGGHSQAQRSSAWLAIRSPTAAIAGWHCAGLATAPTRAANGRLAAGCGWPVRRLTGCWV
jgi:hypothetical protein